MQESWEDWVASQSPGCCRPLAPVCRSSSIGKAQGSQCPISPFLQVSPQPSCLLLRIDLHTLLPALCYLFGSALTYLWLLATLPLGFHPPRLICIFCWSALPVSLTHPRMTWEGCLSEGLLRSRWPVDRAWAGGGGLSPCGRPSPLWAVPFPGQGVFDLCKSRESKLSTRPAGIYCSLF